MRLEYLSPQRPPFADPSSKFRVVLELVVGVGVNENTTVMMVYKHATTHKSNALTKEDHDELPAKP